MIKANTQALVLCALFVVSATGQTWDGGGAAGGAVAWSTAANWNPDGVPANNGTANIIMAGTVDTTNTVDVNFDINGLTFNSTAGAFAIGSSGGATLTIRGGGIVVNQFQVQTKTINVPLILGASQTWSVLSAGLNVTGTVDLGANQLTLHTPSTTPTISSVIEGDGSFVKTGTSSAQIVGSAGNTYTGLTTVNDGSLLLTKTSGNAIPGNLTIGDGIGAAGSDLVRLGNLNQIADTSTVTIHSTGRLDINGLSDTIGLLRMFGGSVTTAGGTLTLNDNLQVDATATINSTISGRLNLGGATREFQVADSAASLDLDVSALIAGGGVTKTGAGFMQYTGSSPNTYTGTTTVNAGTLHLNKNDNVLALAGDLVINDGAIVSNGHVGQTSAATDVAIGNEALLSLSFDAVIGSLSLNQGKVQSLASATLTVSGPITVNNTGPVFSWMDVGAGSVVLTGTAGNVSVASVDANSDQFAISGSVISTNGLAKTGAGQLGLFGNSNNQISGTTTINQGRLILGKDSGITALGGNIIIGDGVGGFNADDLSLLGSNQIAQSASDTVTVNSSGFFNLGGRSEGIGNLVLSAGQVSSGTISFAGSVTSLAHDFIAIISSNIDLLGSTTPFTVNDGLASSDLYISGAMTNGSFSKSGLGTLRLAGANANSATLLQITDGTVLLDKTAGVNALGGTDVTISDGSGPPQSDVLRYGANDHQLPDSITVSVQSAGLLDLNGRSDAIGSLTISGGAVQTGAGTLTINTQVNSNGATAAGSISGNLNLGGGDRPFDVADSAAPAIDLNVTATMSNGTLVKQNAGTLSLSASALTSNISYRLDGGEISADGLSIVPGRSFTMNAGTFSGALNNNGAFIYNAGIFTGELINKTTGASTFNADFTAATGLTNEGAITIAAGRSLVAGGSGITNDGTFNLNGGTLAATSSSFVNDRIITGHGSLIAGGHALVNSGDIVVSDGRLLINSALGLVNSGTIIVGSGLDLHLSGGGVVQNVGRIQLNGGRVLGPLTITNGAGGEIRGGSSVETPINNVGGVIHAFGTGTLTITSLSGNSTGGELRIDDGATLVVHTEFSSSGTIVLAGANATLIGGNVTNTGTIRGAGRVVNVIANSGTIRAENGTLTLPGTGHSNTAAGRIEAGIGAQVLFSQGLATNTGIIALNGGAFDNNNIALSNPGRIEGNGSFRIGGLTNTGTISVGGTLDVLGPVTQNAIVDTQAGSTTRFFNPVSGPGNYTGLGSVQYLNTFSPGASPAAVSFGGNVSFAGSSTLVIEIGGLTAGSQFDHIEVAGTANLGGTLDISLINGFNPVAGNSFELLHSAGGIFGEFADVSLPTLAAGLDWNLIYSNFAATLQVASTGLPGDYNQNGTVDAADYVVWRKNLGGIYTQDDYNVWRAHLGETAGSGSGAIVNDTVPETTTQTVFVALLAMFVRPRTRKP